LYIKKTYRTGEVIEVEKIHSRRYPRGQKREKRKKPSPEQMKKVNERNQIKKLRRIMNANFEEGDLHTVLTYRKDERPTPEEAKKILKKFLDGMRKEYKKRGEQFKYIIVTEYEKTAIHHHIVINSLKTESTTKLVQRIWKHGRPKYTSLEDNGQYERLARYFVKEIKDPEDGVKKQKYSCSRNLIRPEPAIKVISAKTFGKEPKALKGYYIVKDSIIEGISEVTGYPYQYYTMMKIKRRN